MRKPILYAPILALLAAGCASRATPPPAPTASPAPGIIRETVRAAIGQPDPELLVPARPLPAPAPGDDPLALYLDALAAWAEEARLRAALIGHLERIQALD